MDKQALTESALQGATVAWLRDRLPKRRFRISDTGAVMVRRDRHPDQIVAMCEDCPWRERLLLVCFGELRLWSVGYDCIGDLEAVLAEFTKEVVAQHGRR